MFSNSSKSISDFSNVLTVIGSVVFPGIVSSVSFNLAINSYSVSSVSPVNSGLSCQVLPPSIEYSYPSLLCSTILFSVTIISLIFGVSSPSFFVEATISLVLSSPIILDIIVYSVPGSNPSNVPVVCQVSPPSIEYSYPSVVSIVIVLSVLFTTVAEITLIILLSDEITSGSNEEKCSNSVLSPASNVPILNVIAIALSS